MSVSSGSQLPLPSHTALPPVVGALKKFAFVMLKIL